MADTATTPHPLQNRNFRLLCMGNAVSWTGDQFYLVALPWLILQLTGSSIVLGTITMLGAIPRAVLMLIGGALTDRVSPRRVLIMTAAVRSVLVAAIAVSIWTHSLTLWQLYLLAFAFGIADAFAAPAAQTYLPLLVEPEQLPAANSVLQSTNQLTTLVAPAPAGLFIRSFGIAWALFLDAISFLFIIGVLGRLSDPGVATSLHKQNVLHSILDGLRYVRRDVALTSLVLVIATLNFASAGPLSVGIAVIAKQRFETPSSFGLLMSILAAGGLLGTLLAGFGKHRRRGRLLLLAGTTIGLCLVLIGVLDQFASLASALFLTSGMAALLNLQLIAWFQQRVERAMLGRVMSILIFFSIGLIPFSLAAAGIAITWSLSGTFIVAGIVVILAISLAATRRLVRELD